MRTLPIVNGVQLTDAQERRIRQIDYLLKKALFIDREDANLAMEMVRTPAVYSASRHNGQTFLLFGPQAEVDAFIKRDALKMPPPRTYRDPHDRYHGGFGDYEYDSSDW